MFDDLFDSSSDWYDDSTSFDNNSCFHDDCSSEINPGSGLPMNDCSIDIGGYIYGDCPDYS